jgi:hypothetical protein
MNDLVRLWRMADDRLECYWRTSSEMSARASSEASAPNAQYRVRAMVPFLKPATRWRGTVQALRAPFLLE